VGLAGEGDAPGHQTDTVQQSQKLKADILPVIDDSCSMSDEQTIGVLTATAEDRPCFPLPDVRCVAGAGDVERRGDVQGAVERRHRRLGERGRPRDRDARTDAAAHREGERWLPEDRRDPSKVVKSAAGDQSAQPVISCNRLTKVTRSRRSCGDVRPRPDAHRWLRHHLLLAREHRG
jgi:hypothetical protein